MVTLAILTTESELNVMEGPQKTRMECPSLSYTCIFVYKLWDNIEEKKKQLVKLDDKNDGHHLFNYLIS